MKKKPTWILLAACVGVVACDVALTEPLSALGQALEAEDAATSDDATTDDATTDDATTDDADDGSIADGDCDGPGGRRDRGIAPPDGFDDVEVEACALPLEEGVDAGRRPHHRGHLAPLYDEDESHDLSEEEAAALAADVAEGCAARGAALLASWDADGSGALSQTEWDAARAALRAAHEAERADLDTDGDGRLSREEHEAAHAALMATWDLDDSGDLDETERAAMREDLQALVRAGERLPPLPPPPGGRGGRRGGHRPPPPGEEADDAGATE